MNAVRKMQAARAALVLDQPFFGVLALRLNMVPDPGCGTAWIDGVTLGFDPAFIDSLSHAEVTALVCHEVMHCACGHPWRREGRSPGQWNRAADLAINPVLKDAGFTLPAGALLDAEHAGKSAEYIFDRIPGDGPPESPQDSQDGPGEGDGGQDGQDGGQDGQDGPQDGQDGPGEGDGGQDGQDGGQDGQDGPQDGQDGPGEGDGGQDGQGRGGPCRDPLGEVRDAPTGTGDAEGNTEADWKRAVQESARAAEGRGDLPGSLKRYAGELARPRVNWRSVLRRFCQDVARSDYSWTRPNPRFFPRGLYLPALHAEGMGPLVVAIDTSGSIDDVLVSQFGAELAAIAEDMAPELVTVLYVDTEVQNAETFQRGESVEINAVGGGGTDFRPAFAYVEGMDTPPACFVYLTDLMGSFPDTEPSFPVLWATTEDPATLPTYYRPAFGELVEIQS